jgi:hypothetical protein
MPRELAGFLRDFIEMRKSLPKQGPMVKSAVPEPVGPAVRKMKKGPPSTSAAVLDDLAGLSLQKIIEEKPAKAEVCQYFQQMCDRLTAEKMAA